MGVTTAEAPRPVLDQRGDGDAEQGAGGDAEDEDPAEREPLAWVGRQRDPDEATA